MLTTEEVTRFISPPPSTVEGFERFIAWTLQQRAAGAYVCYAVTLEGCDTAIGIFQVRQLNANFDTAEWGFAIGSSFWGTGVFQESAELVLDFAFDTWGWAGSRRGSPVPNGRGKGALRKMGAVQDGCSRSRCAGTASCSIRRCIRFSAKTGASRAQPRPRTRRRCTDDSATMKGPAPGPAFPF